MDHSTKTILKAGCPTPRCRGTTFALNDGAARLAGRMGREHYQCERCLSRWSLKAPDVRSATS